MEENFKLNDYAQNLFIVNKFTIDKLFTLSNCADCIALYVFYYKTAKWQNTNTIKANDEYIKKALKWGNEKIKKTKQVLKEYGLIDIIQRRKEGKIDGWYIQVNYLISERKKEEIKTIIQNIEDIKNSRNQQVDFATCGFQETNAYKINNINAYKDKNNMNIIFNWNDNDKCQCYTQNKTICERRSSYNINGVNYCNQHSKIIFSKIFDDNNISKEKTFTKPTIKEIEEYCKERNNNIDAEYFYDYYESNGWMVGKTKMKDWKATIRTWERNDIKIKNKKREEEKIDFPFKVY